MATRFLPSDSYLVELPRLQQHLREPNLSDGIYRLTADLLAEWSRDGHFPQLAYLALLGDGFSEKRWRDTRTGKVTEQEELLPHQSADGGLARLVALPRLHLVQLSHMPPSLVPAFRAKVEEANDKGRTPALELEPQTRRRLLHD